MIVFEPVGSRIWQPEDCQRGSGLGFSLVCWLPLIPLECGLVCIEGLFARLEAADWLEMQLWAPGIWLWVEGTVNWIGSC